MQLICRNIGKIHEAKVNINGITVVTGLNDTGKSTLSKALYCSLYSTASMNVSKIELDKMFKSEFNNQVSKDTKEESEICLNIGDDNFFKIQLSDNEISSFENSVDIKASAIYIDSLSILDGFSLDNQTRHLNDFRNFLNIISSINEDDIYLNEDLVDRKSVV